MISTRALLITLFYRPLYLEVKAIEENKWKLPVVLFLLHFTVYIEKIFR